VATSSSASVGGTSARTLVRTEKLSREKDGPRGKWASRVPRRAARRQLWRAGRAQPQLALGPVVRPREARGAACGLTQGLTRLHPEFTLTSPRVPESFRWSPEIDNTYVMNHNLLCGPVVRLTQ
jgi:hypothetical protein